MAFVEPTTAAPHTAPWVTRSQIAQAIDVADQAVSNWARRFSDFPTRVAGMQRTAYRLDEVVAWLEAHNLA